MPSATKTAQVRLDHVTRSHCRVVLDNPPLNLMGPEFVVQIREVVTALENDDVKVVAFESAVDRRGPVPPRLAVSGGRYSAMGGGVPLTHEDQVIAGVGVSGGTTEQDIAIVEAAMT